MPTLPPPQVPQKLREMLKDHPEHIARLQEILNQYVENPLRRRPFDGAVWALAEGLGVFLAESGNELKAAETSGDVAAIAKASHQLNLMFNAGYFAKEMVDMDDLWDYFQINKEAFE